jgi:hypothetical protein
MEEEQVQEPVLAVPKPQLRLDLACGKCCQKDFEGVDIVAGKGVKHVVNLFKFPWPWADNSVDEIYCSHFIEHIPMVYIGKGLGPGVLGNFCECPQVIKAVPDDSNDQDLFFAFFDECWRILRHEGKMTVLCPSATSDRAFQDPTHRRFIVAETFSYLSAVWRKSVGMDHYNVKCSFGFKLDAATAKAEECAALGELSAARIAEVQQRMMKHYRNFVLDWVVVMVANKKPDEIVDATRGDNAAPKG